MNIYDSDGALNLDAARKANNALPRAAVDPKMQAQQIANAALLDIAESLRPLAAEALAAAAENAIRHDSEDDSGFGSEYPFEVGDVVYVEGIDGPGEIVGFRDTEGETFAVVRYSGGSVTTALRNLHRLVGDEGDEPDPLAEVIIDKPGESDFEPIAGSTDNGDGTWTHPGNPDLTDELDEDFDGDAHTAAEDAVAKLAEAEAKRKAEKKGKAKK